MSGFFSLENLVSVLWSLGSFAIVIGLSVLIHEGGHFLAARFFGIRVKVFSIGFGKPLFKFERGGTKYQIASIPIGGYVKMAGEEPGEERTGAPDEFASKHPLKRMAVVFAGPIANILSAGMIMIAAYWIGVPSIYNEAVIGYVADEAKPSGIQTGDKVISVNGISTPLWDDVAGVVDDLPQGTKNIPVKIERGGKVVQRDLPLQWNEKGQVYFPFAGAIPPVVGQVKWGAPAQRAGLMEGDKIMVVGDTVVMQWSDVSEVVHNSPGIPVTLKVNRDGQILSFTITPEKKLVTDMNGDQHYVGLMGISSYKYTRSYGFTEGIRRGILHTWGMGRVIFEILVKLVGGEVPAKVLSGPIGIAQGTGSMAREGLIELAVFTAFLSVNLGILNLLPLPVLDGGWIAIFLSYELIRRRPMSEKWQIRLTQIGIALLLFLVVFATSNDFGRLFGMNVVDK